MIARRPNPDHVWCLNARDWGGGFYGSLLIRPGLTALDAELTVQPQQRQYFRIELEHEELLRRLLNERHKAREVQERELVPELYSQIDKLKRELREAREKVKEVFGPEAKG